jgi:hypothetical protein
VAAVKSATEILERAPSTGNFQGEDDLTAAGWMAQLLKNINASTKAINWERIIEGPNENKISDGWRDSASLRVEGGISWKVRDRDCQTFAASFG